MGAPFRSALLALALIFAFASTAFAAAGQVVTPATDWLVYHRLDGNATRGMIGRLELDAQEFRYQSLNLLDSWVMALASVESIALENQTGQGLMSSAIVIEGVEDGKRVRRLIAPVDERFRPLPISVLAGLMHYKLQQFKDAKAAAAVRRQQNDQQ